jgi:hypothetical protein
MPRSKSKSQQPKSKKTLPPEVTPKMDIATAKDPSQLDIVVITQLKVLPEVTSPQPQLQPNEEDALLAAKVEDLPQLQLQPNEEDALLAAKVEDPPQLDIAAATQLEALPEVLPKMKIATAEDPPQNDIADLSSLGQLPDTKMDHNVETTTTIHDIDNRPFKKVKYSEPSILDNLLLSPTISTTSMITECSESVDSESDKQIDDEPLPTVDNKQPDEPNQAKDNVKYDYLPQDYTLRDEDACSLCIILDSSEEDILVKMDDISVALRKKIYW